MELYTAAGVGCQLCPELCASRRNIVDGAGAVNPLLMVVAEAPGEFEDKQGTPFVGDSGQFIRAALSESGIHASRIYMTNAVKCRPENNRDPNPDELDSCQVWLEDEIERLQPRVILTLGKYAKAAIESIAPACIVRDVVHPAAILRSTAPRLAWQTLIKEAVDLALGVERGPVYAGSVDPWSEGTPDIWSPWLAVDTETDDLEEGYGKTLVSVQVSDGDKVQFIAVRPGDTFSWTFDVGARVFAHNIKYDAPLIGLDLDNLHSWDDTGIMAYVLRYPRVGLKVIGPEITGIYMEPISSILKYRLKTRSVLKSKCRDCKGMGQLIEEADAEGIDIIPCPSCEGEGHPVRYKEKWAKRSFSEALAMEPELARTYANKDPVVTSRIARYLVAELHKPGNEKLREYYETIEKPVLPVIAEMERNGVKIDVDALIPLRAELDAALGEIERAITDELGQTLDFNPNSNQQLAEAMLGAGWTLKDMTPTGEWQLDVNVLCKLAGVDSKDDIPEGTLIGNILEMRRMRKLRSTYVEKLIDLRDENGRVHTSFNQMVAGTNRLSSSDPINLQNIPIRGKIGKSIRKTFIPEPGFVIVKGDASQLEVRLFAHYTRDPVLVDAYPWDGPARDVHQGVADALDIARWRAKNTLFCAVYGGGGDKLAATAGVEGKLAAEFLARMRVQMPSLVTWPKYVARLLDTQGYVETWLGWRNYYPNYWSPLRREQRKALREAGNMPIQGTAAGLIKRLMIQARTIAARYDARALLQVHDEMVYEVPAEHVIKFGEELAASFAQIGRDAGISVPLELNVEAGPNWGETIPLSSWNSGLTR